jgi:hypothetical protein
MYTNSNDQKKLENAYEKMFLDQEEQEQSATLEPFEEMDWDEIEDA